MTTRRLAFTFVIALFVAQSSFAQKKRGGDHKPPDAGYVYPPNLRAGTTTEVQLGLLDGTPDLQFFVFDPRIQLQTTAAPGPVLVPPPPYWFGSKSTIVPLPLPREQAAKITIPAEVPPGPVRWAVANASGAGPKTGTFWVSAEPTFDEPRGKGPHTLPTLPVAVSGRLSRIEEVDRYTFTAAKDGPITCEVFGRRLGASMNAALTVKDSTGRVIADAVDTDGFDVAITFAARAGTAYTVEVHDLDFRGDFSFVYRLCVTAGPRVTAVIPAAGKRGSTTNVTLIGVGVASGAAQVESVTRSITCPNDPKRAVFSYKLETPFGTSPAFDIPLSDVPETISTGASEQAVALPAAVTGTVDLATGKSRFKCDGKKGDVWDLAAEARRFGSPLDLSLAVLSAEGKELVRSDDLPGTTDAGLSFTLPADGTYLLEVSDLSGRHDAKDAIFRLSAEKQSKEFTLGTVARVNVSVGGSFDLLVTAKRKGGHKEPIALKVMGLPEGVSVPENLMIPEGKLDLKIPVKVAEDAPALASFVTVTGTSDGITRSAFAPLTGGLAARSPDEERTDKLILATTLRPQIKLVNVEADGGRKVHRGTTHPSEVTIERLEDFKGEVSLQMSAGQSYQRQGITGPDMTVPADADRAFYPCFMPEWLETTRTSRMELIGVVKVPDAKGTLRYVVAPMAGRITMSIEGSILKVSHGAKDLMVKPGDSFVVPVNVLRSAKLTESVTLELKLSEDLAGAFKAAPVSVPNGKSSVDFRVTCEKAMKMTGEQFITIRGTAMQQGKYAVVSEATVPVEVKASR